MQGCFGTIGVHQDVDLLLLDATAQTIAGCTVFTCHGNGSFTAQTGLALEQAAIGLPVRSLPLAASGHARRCMGVPVKRQRQVFMHKTDESCVDVVPLERDQHLLVKALAVGAFKIAEFDNRHGCIRTAQGRGAFDIKRLDEVRSGLGAVLGLSDGVLDLQGLTQTNAEPEAQHKCCSLPPSLLPGGMHWHWRRETIEYCQSSGILTAGAWLDLDLLRRRREELGLQELSTLPVAKLLVRGSAIGGGFLALALLLILGIFVQWRFVLHQRGQLTPAAQEFDAIQEQLATTRASIGSTTDQNSRIANAMAGIRSGSALLTELQRLLPATMRFRSIAVRGSQLELTGEAQEPMAVEAINSFQLRLDGSSFFEPDGMALEQADAGTADQVATLSFDIKGDFADDALQATRSRLTELDAFGLAKRMDRLQREGLLP